MNIAAVGEEQYLTPNKFYAPNWPDELKFGERLRSLLGRIALFGDGNMETKGKQHILATCEILWAALNDPERLSSVFFNRFAGALAPRSRENIKSPRASMAER